MIGQPSQQRPPVGYWDLWPNGPVPSEDARNAEIRKNIEESSVAQRWHFYGQSVFDNVRVPALSSVETEILCSTLGWILKIEAIVVSEYRAAGPLKELYLSCTDISGNKQLFKDVNFCELTGGEKGKSYATFSYILNSRNPLRFVVSNRDTAVDPLTWSRCSVLVLGKLYRGTL